MTLKDILNSKPSKIITCNVNCIVADAISVMDAKGVGSILVYDDHKKLAGIFTERDIMKCFVRNISFTNEVMARIMTPNPLVLDSSTDVSVAMNMMSERKFRHLPVSENGEIIGVISYRDLVSHILPGIIYMTGDSY
ncbi:MAG TPA: CBS domain-containing protein [Nitrospirae bacterium]|nr:CBS domain-containing protein [Nitrospirota bacterium]